MNYLVLDLETANSDCASICQIGVVEIADGAVIGQASHLIDPCCAFDPWNVRIHGIEAAHVEGAPDFAAVFAALAPQIEDRIVVTHGSFDRIAIHRACERHGLHPVPVRWLDNQTVVRRTWPQFARKGYSLGNLARHFDITFRHHDALEDALATAEVFRRALQESGRSASEWHALVAGATPGSRLLRSGLAGGPFAGQNVVFTGRMRIARQLAAERAAARGFDVGAAVTPATTILCVGSGPGAGKSSKQREAERLMAGGHPLAILDEDAFWRMLSP